MKKTRECIYCKHFFECKERADVERCIRFEPRDKDAEERYKAWQERRRQ